MLQVHLKARFILNGVCVIWKGWIDCNRLDGTGCLEFDEEKSLVRKWCPCTSISIYII